MTRFKALVQLRIGQATCRVSSSCLGWHEVQTDTAQQVPPQRLAYSSSMLFRSMTGIQHPEGSLAVRVWASLVDAVSRMPLPAWRWRVQLMQSKHRAAERAPLQ